MASRGRFLGHGSWLQFRDESASISSLNNMHFSHDRATIGPGSGRGRATIAPRSRHDRELGAQMIAFRIRGKARALL